MPPLPSPPPPSPFLLFLLPPFFVPVTPRKFTVCPRPYFFLRVRLFSEVKLQLEKSRIFQSFYLIYLFSFTCLELPDEGRGPSQRCQDRPDELRLQRGSRQEDHARIRREGRGGGQEGQCLSRARFALCGVVGPDLARRWPDLARGIVHKPVGNDVQQTTTAAAIMRGALMTLVGF